MALVPSKQRQSGVYDPFQYFQNMQREMNRVFGSLTPAVFPGESMFQEIWSPDVDIADRKDKITVRAELPGIRKEDIDIDVQGNMVSIRGEKKQQAETKEGDFLRKESYQGMFSRTFTLPEEIDAQKAKASYKDGVLELELPKKPEAQDKHRRIQVQ